jgi:antitoxin VapB
MSAERRVRLFRSGPNQAVRIPVEFELPGDEAILRRDGDRLVLEPVKKTSFLEFLDSLEPWGEEFPDIHEDLPPLREIDL